MNPQDFVNLLTPLASVIVSGGISWWIYKTLSWKVKEQSQTILRLEKEIEKLKDNEHLISTKYMKVVAMILRNKSCSNGAECTIFSKYVEMIEREGAI